MSLILTEEDPPSFCVVNHRSTAPVLLICDHASNLVPRALDNLGLSPEVMELHVAFDKGAAEVTRLVAADLGVPACLTNYSRLVVDCNRAPDHEQIIPRESDGVKIPANASLGADRRRKIMDEIYWPYQKAVGEELRRLDESLGAPAMLVAIHSFTSKLAVGGEERPWQVGIAYKDDEKTARKIIDYFRREGSLIVGDNKPFALRDSYTILAQSSGGRPRAFIEIRRDQISSAEDQRRFASLLSSFLRKTFPGRL